MMVKNELIRAKIIKLSYFCCNVTIVNTIDRYLILSVI